MEYPWKGHGEPWKSPYAASMHGIAWKEHGIHGGATDSP